MIRLCRRNRTKLGVISQMWFGTEAARLKETVESGALGRVFLADAVDKSSRQIGRASCRERVYSSV